MRPPEEIYAEAVERFKAGDYAEAVYIFDKLLSHTDTPDFKLFVAYGTALAASGTYPGMAIHFLRRAIDEYPHYPDAWSNLGLVLKSVGRDKAALNCYAKALDLDKDNAVSLANIAGWYVNRGEPERVVEYARKALASPKAETALADAHTHLALGLMEQGKFDEAWPHYAHRWNIAQNIKNRRPYKAPPWKGEKVGKLAIHGEQGLGDEILFMSCFKKTWPLADRIVVECAGRLVNLFGGSFRGDIAFYPDHASLIEAEGEPDAYTAMGSLPGIVGLPDGRPFLERGYVPPIEKSKLPRIGIAWRGGTNKTNKRERTIKLDHLAPILSTPGCEFVSVQYGEQEVDDEAAAHGLPQLLKGRSIDHSVDAISRCDLIITVCQTAVHLAGAMGIPCWVLTPKQCAWRYSGKTDRMLPWYESVRLYRQDDTEKWEPVIERIAADLKAWM